MATINTTAGVTCDALPSALLFDLDGTVCDTDPLHLEVFAALFAEWGAPHVGHEFFNKYISGRLNHDIFSAWMPGKPSDEEIEAASAAKEARFRDVARGRLNALAGLHELMSAAKHAGVPMAAVTNAPRLNAEFMIEQCKLSPYLQSLVIGMECTRAKPFPDPYVEGMRRVNATTKSVVIFEDSETGASAGALVIGVCTGHSEYALKAAGAYHCVKDFTELSLPLLSELLVKRAGL